MRILCLCLTVVVAAAHRVEARSAASRTSWKVEESAGRVTLRLPAAATVQYMGMDPARPELVIACTRSSDTLEVYVDVAAKPDTFDFAVRFGQAPAVSYEGKMGPGRNADVLHQLRVPEAQATAFVSDVLRHPRLLVRYTRGQLREASFDLAGVTSAATPLGTACGLEEALQAARQAPVAPAATVRPTGPRERRIGSWEVREKTSSVDDKPVVVLATSARRPDWTQLILRCQESEVEAFLAAGSVVDTNKQGVTVIPIGLDSEPPTDVSATTSTDHTALFLPDSRSFVRSLRGHRQLKVRFQRYRAPRPVDAVFDLDGIDQALAVFTKACPLG